MAFHCQAFEFGNTLAAAQLDQHTAVSNQCSTASLADLGDIDSEKENESAKEPLDLVTVYNTSLKITGFNISHFDFHIVSQVIIGLFSSRAPPTYA